MTGPMSRDERIAAFLDGALGEADLAAFEAELATDPALAAEVERMMGNDAAVRAAFSGSIEAGVDTALLDRMGLSLPGPAAANDNPPFWRRGQIPLGGAIAAALALALIMSTQKGAVPGAGFDAALDGTASGQVAAIEGGQQIKPLLTFVAGDGRFCREFSIGKGEAGGTGIACRSASDGGWQVEALDQGATELAEGSGIALAAGKDGAGLDSAYARLGASDPLGIEREQALIAKGWDERAK